MIQIITTGGTIEGIEYDSNKSRKIVPEVNITEHIKTANVSLKYTIEQAFSKDSRHITQKDRELLKQLIQGAPSSKILITHGTISMTETATFLGELAIDKTIVLVGSFTLGNKKKTDASFNLGFALCSLNFLDKGVYIVMHGKIFPWYAVKKNTKLNRFESTFI